MTSRMPNDTIATYSGAFQVNQFGHLRNFTATTDRRSRQHPTTPSPHFGMLLNVRQSIGQAQEQHDLEIALGWLCHLRRSYRTQQSETPLATPTRTVFILGSGDRTVCSETIPPPHIDHQGAQRRLFHVSRSYIIYQNDAHSRPHNSYPDAQRRSARSRGAIKRSHFDGDAHGPHTTAVIVFAGIRFYLLSRPVPRGFAAVCKLSLPVFSTFTTLPNLSPAPATLAKQLLDLATAISTRHVPSQCFRPLRLQHLSPTLSTVFPAHATPFKLSLPCFKLLPPFSNPSPVVSTLSLAILNSRRLFSTLPTI